MNLASIKQLFRGEEHPDETLEIKHDGDDLDNRGYFRFLQATKCLKKDRGNMLTEKDWGTNRNCTLFCFNNAANGDLFSSVLNPKQLGEIRYILNFGGNQPANFTVSCLPNLRISWKLTRTKPSLTTCISIYYAKDCSD